ncbi:MFS general substrate transporter, partial [Panus rudis PR-1116 ss-1]
MIPPGERDAMRTVDTLVDSVPRPYSVVRRYALLLLFCLAQFLDSFNNSALYTAIPSIGMELDMAENETTWLVSAFQLTFASFLLISGRISDIYNPKYAFIFGITALGGISIGAGFVREKITLIVLRALSGIAAALTIPSSLTLLVNLFPEGREQAHAIGAFGGCSAIGNVLGLVIGALFVEFTTWPWVFWFVAIIALPIAGICLFLIPPDVKADEDERPLWARWRSLDMIGVSILTAALILFIFALTSGSTSGWATARVLAPLVISVFMVAGFFYYETCIPADVAAVPPRTWFLPNFAVLFGVALMPYFWWTTIYTLYTTLWQDVFHWSVISTALRMLPLGILAMLISLTGGLARKISPKYILILGQILAAIGTVLLPFANGPDKYFRFVLPGFILGTIGSMLTYTHTNIAIFRTSPSSMAGTVGAIFNGALQLGSAIGIAAMSSIETSLDAAKGDFTSYRGRAAAFWFVFGVVCLQVIFLSVFYRIEKE